MSRVRVTPFKVEHLDIMEMRDAEMSGICTLKDFKERINALAQAGDAGTVICDGRIITCMGFLELWPGVAEVWQLPSIYVQKHRLAYCKTILSYLESTQKLLNLHRIQTDAPDDKLHANWMHYLGFTCEGVRRKYSHTRRDYALWAKVF